jgi:UDP-glucose 4-epimerase
MGVLVTGGAGYIGSIAVERLLDAGEQVVVLDNLSTGYREAVDNRAEFVKADILDTSRVAETLKHFQIDTVMHFAAFIAVGESCENPTKYFRNNVSGALSVLDAMVGAKTARFIMSSTAAVYGDPETVPITEDMPLRPKNPYGLSKRMIEQALEWYGVSHKLQHVIFRYFNAAGASSIHGEAHRPETHLIPNILMAADGAHERITSLAVTTTRRTEPAYATMYTWSTSLMRIFLPCAIFAGAVNRKCSTWAVHKDTRSSK